MDFLERHKPEVEKAVYFAMADLMNADVDLIFYDTTSLHFEVDEEDEAPRERFGRRYEALRKRGHSKNGRGDAAQVVIGLAVTRDGLPVRSWVFPGHTADVTTVEKVKEDLRGWRLGRCVFVGDGERRQRYVICHNPAEQERQHAHRTKLVAELVAELEAELAAMRDLDGRSKRAHELIASARFGKYLRQTASGELRIDRAAIEEAQRYDGKWVLTSNDDTLTAEDLALGYKQLLRVEQCWRQLKSSVRMRPVFHFAPWRIQAHVSISVLALLLERIAEIRVGDTWPNIVAQLQKVKVVEYDRAEARVRQTTEMTPEAEALLRKLHVAPPPKLHSVEAAPALDSPAADLAPSAHGA